MKALKVVASSALIALAALTAGQAFADTQVSEQMKLDCFKAHKQLMDKPAVKTVDACWRAHGYLMQK